MAVDLYANVSLLEEHGLGPLTKKSVAESGLEPAPAGRDGAADVTDVFIIHCEQSTQSVPLHRFSGAIQPILP